MERMTFDLERATVRDVNQYLHGSADVLDGQAIVVASPNGAHNIAVGVDADVTVTIDGHAGYYAGGMNKRATIVIEGSAGTGGGPLRHRPDRLASAGCRRACEARQPRPVPVDGRPASSACRNAAASCE